MSQSFSYGLKINGLVMGAIAVDGGAGTVLTSPGKVRENTLRITPAENTDTEFFEEGDDSAPAITISKRGIKEITFDLLTFDPEVLADLTGGTVTGDGENMLYNEPLGNTNVEKTLKATDTQGKDWLYPRVKVQAALVGVFTTSDVNVVRVKCKVLKPAKTGVSSFTYGKPAVVV
ncbi:hypothetical protein [Pedobacter suwonensis]|uniref:hypothetical protein n=1 Tax=Pedobacter suwonensis TaxID=332999 RepID=UPI0011A307AD|nr:hypothetical protein [Pedobacter suwonensis]